MEQFQSNMLEVQVATQAELEEKIAKVNEQLERYSSDATQQDYALAIASGVLCGAIDSLYVGESAVLTKDVEDIYQEVDNVVKRFAKANGWDENMSKNHVQILEEAFEAAQDNDYFGKISGIVPRNHHLADLAHHPTPAGLMAAIVVQFLNFGLYVNKEGEWTLQIVGGQRRYSLKFVWGCAFVTGVLRWILSLAEHHSERYEELPEALQKLLKALANAPLAFVVIRTALDWVGHLMSDVSGTRKNPGAGMGIPGVFISLLYEIGAVFGPKGKPLLTALDNLFQSDETRFNLRKEAAYLEDLGKQAIPVLINELIVRTFFFVDRLQTELKGKETFDDVNWKAVFPFANRTLDQMLMVSSLTFSFADTTDAAIRAAIESGGTFVIFAGKFAGRFNYVGAGRAIVAVGKEFTNELMEQQLIHEKRLLAQAHSEVTIELFEAYRAELVALVSAYMVERLNSIQLGFTLLDQGLDTNDVDLFLQGNSQIQRAFGKVHAQFETQKEFDEFMDSEDALQL